MTQLIPFNPAALPAHLQQAAGASNINMLAATGTGGGSQVDHISIKGGRFHIVRSGKEPVTLQLFALNVVIIHANPGMTKALFAGAWNPDAEAEAPICSSDDGVTPRADSDKIQCETCAACPQNQFGSKINPQTGKETKACQDKKTIAVVTPGEEGGEMLRLQIPAASLKDFGQYLRSLPNVPYYGVITEITFDTSVSYPKIKFRPVDYVSEQGFAIAASRHQTDEAKMMAGVAGSTPLRAISAQPLLAAPPAHIQPAIQQQIPVQNLPVEQAPVKTPEQLQLEQLQAQLAAAQQAMAAAQQPTQVQPVVQAVAQPQSAPLSNAPQPQDPSVAAIFGGQGFGQQTPAAGAQQTTPVVHSTASVALLPSGREPGKPSPGKKRRTKVEMAEDAAMGIGAAAGETSEEDDTAQQAQTQVVQQPAGKSPEQLQLEAQLAALQAQLAAAQQPAQVAQAVQQPAQTGGFGAAPVQQAAPIQQPANQPQVVTGDLADAFAGWDD